MRHAVLLLALALPATSFAQDRQYRRLKLTDGREIKAEVLETVATGLKMRVPQGETLISFEILMDMVPIDASEYRDQQPIKVWVHAPGYESKMAAIYGEVKELVVASDENLPPGVIIGLTECAAEFDCMESKLAGQDWMWLVTVQPPQDDTKAALIVRGRTSGGTEIQRADATTDSAADLWHAGLRVIGLINEGEVPKSVLTAVGETDVTVVPDPVPDPDAGLGWTRNRVYSSAWTPLPGYSALAQKDTGGFATGLAIGVLGTGVVGGLMAANRVDAPEAIGITAASYYVLSVATNQAFGMKAYNKAKGASVGVHVAPTPGGATFGIGGRLK
ncbi:MAG: hypothetical protein H6737_25580 [Alphaproteobacteria bacterium]|nr:hypothetical protein [Alphaproteobacteria bacterium]